MIEANKESTYSIDCHDIVEVVEFSPYEWSSDLLAVATTARISVGSCRFQVKRQVVVNKNCIITGLFVTTEYFQASVFETRAINL